MATLARLQEALGYEFRDESLLRLALTHRSAGKRNNERLEFLGDSIVNHVVAEAIYHRFPGADEGEMSRMRASLVKGDTLAKLAREFDLGDYLELGTGERRSGGHRRNSILADAFEAISGAMLLDSDPKTTRENLLRWFDERLSGLDRKANPKDAKTQLQEYLQGRGHSLPDYALVSSHGEDHAREFVASCEVPALELRTEGKGSSRRKAEQAAASLALQELDADG